MALMDAHAAFFRQQKDRLFAYLMRMTGDYYLAGDVLQESFARYLEHYRRKEASISLLYAIARNALVDTLRKHSRNVGLGSDPAESAHDPESRLLIREAYRRMLAALQRLDPPDRELIALVADGELKYRDVAALAGISEANVKVRVHRIRLKLKQILEEERPWQIT
jgi:RNA polymerase sigma-70 factor (ECF subfamily)